MYIPSEPSLHQSDSADSGGVLCLWKRLWKCLKDKREDKNAAATKDYHINLVVDDMVAIT